MNLNDAPEKIRAYYPDPSKVKDVTLVENEHGGETYTVTLDSGIHETWQKVSYWWKLVNVVVDKTKRGFRP